MTQHRFTYISTKWSTIVTGSLLMGGWAEGWGEIHQGIYMHIFIAHEHRQQCAEDLLWSRGWVKEARRGGGIREHM